MEIDLHKRIAKDFGNESSIAVNLLSAFEVRYKLSPRISRCIIHLAKGDINKLKIVIENAETDWRDVITAAESFDFEFNRPFI